MKTDFIFRFFNGGRNVCVLMVYWAFPFQRNNPRDRNVRGSEGRGNIWLPRQDTRGNCHPSRGGEAVSPDPDIEWAGRLSSRAGTWGAPRKQGGEFTSEKQPRDSGVGRGPAAGLREAWWRWCFSKGKISFSVSLPTWNKAAHPLPCPFLQWPVFSTEQLAKLINLGHGKPANPF